jgi:prephenate dehydrogenase
MSTLEVNHLKVTVIGGAGRMGRWLVNYFIERGHQVTISDTRYEEAKAVAQSAGAKIARNNIEAVKDAEITVLSTPIEVTPNVLMEISSKIQKSATVVEISSLKSQVFPSLEKIATQGIRTLSIHPLFGPGVTKITEEKIALVPVSDPSSEFKLAKMIFPKAELIVVDVEEHDEAMALALSLPHFLNIVFASVIGQKDINVLKKLGGTTFALQLILSEGVMSEDPSLYASIQMDNKFTAQILERFLLNAETLKRHITERDSKGFLQFYADARTSLMKDSDFGKAYEKMYKALEAL